MILWFLSPLSVKSNVFIFLSCNCVNVGLCLLEFTFFYSLQLHSCPFSWSSPTHTCWPCVLLIHIFILMPCGSIFSQYVLNFIFLSNCSSPCIEKHAHKPILYYVWRNDYLWVFSLDSSFLLVQFIFVPLVHTLFHWNSLMIFTLDGKAGNQTEALMHTRQILYCWAISPLPIQS